MSRKMALRVCLVLMVTGPSSGATKAASQEPSETIVFVKGKRADQMRAEGSVWRQGRSFIESTGAEGGLYGRLHLGAGPFTLRARLRIGDLALSEAALAIDAARFGFGGDADGGPLWVAGELLIPGGKRTPIAGTEGLIEEGKEFELEVERTANALEICVDGAVVHRVNVDAVRLGAFGLLPAGAKICVLSLEATGDLCDPFDTFDERLEALQPAIDAAIDRGVDFLVENQRRDGSWVYENEIYAAGETSLAVYALIKSGLEPDHPAVLRALRYLELAPCHETYAASCQLMALGAIGSPAYRPRMQELLDQLLDWETNGSWSYPWGSPDLSNAQYAALGLRAAHEAGLEVPVHIWHDLIVTTLRYQERTRKNPVLDAIGRPGKSRLRSAGFLYRPGWEPVTGSMTTAGITILATCRAMLDGGLPRKMSAKVQEAIELGVAWLVRHFRVDKNPNKEDWHYYYLYGLERTGSLLRTELIGEHAWYYEGAKHLIKQQAKDGSWSEKAKDLDTCFGLLFLDRATAAATSGISRRKRERTYASESVDHFVSFRAANHKPMVLWVTGFSEEMITEHGHGEAGLKVRHVELLVDGVVVQTLGNDVGTSWKADRFVIRHSFPRCGAYQVNVRVTTYPPLGEDPGVILGEALTVNVDDVLGPWMLPAVQDSAANLLRGRELEAGASSHQSEYDEAAHAFDACMDTRWMCDYTDVHPELTVDFKRPVTVGRIAFSQAARSQNELGACDRISEIEVRINRDKNTLRLKLVPDELQKTMLELDRPTQIRRLWVRIVSREEGASLRGHAGFTEIEFLSSED
ncbi:MAG: hypothetical protein ACI8Y8_003638 [Planctomycetota bacterium]|jgi:hypothetical protein